MARSTVSGIAARTIDGGDTESSECRAMIACAVDPVNGGSPTSISYVTHSRLYSSLRPSISTLPVACSGLMYAGVPMTVPVCVMWCASPAALSARAMPKSATTAVPPESMMFSGLMSRCTTPWLCAYASAPATSAVIRRVSSSDSCFSRSRRSRSDSPSTYGMT